jgi:hypothetical protein
MNSLQFFFHNAWRWHLGMPELEEEFKDPFEKGKVPDIETIAKLKFNDDFVILMRNRMIMGYFRYGANKPELMKKLDFIGSAKQRIERYEKDGNLEHLVDAANILRMEFEMPHHPNAHFQSIDDGEHSHQSK